MADPDRPTDKERAHFAAVARAMSEQKRAQLASAARAQTADGILEGLELAVLSSPTLETEVQARARAAGQVGLRLRWRHLQAKADR